MKITISLTDEEIRENPFCDKNGKPAFYNFLEKSLTNNTIETIDPRKISVSKDIADAWKNYCRTEIGENYLVDFAMMIVDRGPHIDDKLPEHTVVICENAFSFKE